MAWQRSLVIVTVLSIYALMVVGAYVTTAGYGLECPDWPTCHGQLVPPLTGGVVVEYTHRLLTVLTTLLLIASIVAVWRMPSRSRTVFRTLSAAVVLLVVQIILGGVVVGTELNAVVATVHLALAIAIFGMVTAAAAVMGRN